MTAVITATLNPSIDKNFSVKRVIPDRKLVGRNVRAYPGGGGVNVARVVTRLGTSALALWSSGGETGRQLARLLDAEQVPHEPIASEGAVRENLIIRDDSTSEQFRFGLPGPTLAESALWHWVERMRDVPASTRYVVFSGSLPGATPPDWYEEILGAVPDGVRLIVDTKREALRRALKLGVYLIKPNVHELEDLLGRELIGDAAIEHAARGIIERGGAEVVVVSLGRAGALVATNDALERYPALSVRVRSKVGAGDSMVGGLVAALGQGSPLSEAVRLGAAAAAATVMTEGTELCRKADVERLFASVRRQTVSA